MLHKQFYFLAISPNEPGFFLCADLHLDEDNDDGDTGEKQLELLLESCHAPNTRRAYTSMQMKFLKFLRDECQAEVPEDEQLRLWFEASTSEKGVKAFVPVLSQVTPRVVARYLAALQGK